MKSFTNKLALCALLVVSLAGRTGAAQITVFETSFDNWRQDVSAKFAANRDLGRAWIDVEVTTIAAGEEQTTPEVNSKALEGLYYDPALKQVLYRTGNESIVCAEDSSFLWRTYLKSTGRCLLTPLSEKRKIDDGFNIREQTVSKVVFEVRPSTVPADLTAVRRGAPLDHLVDGIVLETGDEEYLLGRQLPEPPVVHVAAIDDENGPRIKAQGARHPDVVPLAFGDDRHAGQVAIVIQQQVELHGALGPPELGPIEQRGAQIDHRRVEAHELVLEAKLPAASGQPLTASQQFLKHGPVELPRPVLIGVGQRRPRRRRNPQVAQFPLAAGQAPADFAQGVGPPQLAEQHRHKLAPAGEPARMPLGIRPLHQGMELGSWE